MKLQSQNKSVKATKRGTRVNTSLGVLRNHTGSVLGQSQSKADMHQAASHSMGIQFLPDLKSFGTNATSVDNRSAVGYQSSQNFLGKKGIPNPNALLYQHNLCKQQNRERLKDVRNLEDLVNFRVETIADKFKEEDQIINPNLIALKNICDPLLIHRNKVSKIKMSQEEEQNKYVIPQYLAKTPENYNLFNEYRIKPSFRTQSENAGSKPQQSDYDMDSQGRKQKQNHDESGFFEINRSHFDSNTESVTDPVMQLKTYFDEKNKAKTLHKAKARLQSQKILEKQLNEASGVEINNEKNYQSFNRLKTNKYGLHPNFVIAKYEKMAKIGKLNKIDQMENGSVDANGNAVLNAGEYDSYVELQNYNKQILLENEMKKQQVEQLKEYNQIQQQLQDVGTLLSGYGATTNTNGLAAQHLQPGMDSYLESDAQFKGEGTPLSGEKLPIYQDGIYTNTDQDKLTIEQASVNLAMMFQSDDQNSTLQQNQSASNLQDQSKIGQAMINIENSFELGQNDYQEQYIAMAQISQAAASKDELQKFSKMVSKDFVGGSIQNGILERQLHDQNSSRMEHLHKSKDEVVQEKLYQILNSQDKNDSGLQSPSPYKTFENYNKASNDATGGGTTGNGSGLTSDKVSGTRYSELRQYQNVKNAGIDKCYVNYTDEQIQLAQKLKNMEQSQSQNKRTAPGVFRANSQATILNNELKKMRTMNKIQKMRQENKSQINYQGSLPQLRNALEKKKISVPSTIPIKSFKEDYKSLKQTFQQPFELKNSDKSDYLQIYGSQKQSYQLKQQPNSLVTKSQDFKIGGKSIGVKKQLKNKNMKGFNRNDSKSLAVSATRINDGSSEHRNSIVGIKKENINLPHAELMNIDPNGHEMDLDNKEKTQRTPLNHGSSRSDNDSVEMNGTYNIKDIIQDKEIISKSIFQNEFQESSQGGQNQSFGKPIDTQVLSSVDKSFFNNPNENSGTIKRNQPYDSPDLTNQLKVLNINGQMGFDTTFSAADVDTNRIERTIDDKSENMEKVKVISSEQQKMEADQADEVELTQDDDVKIVYQPELVDIKMMDQDFNTHGDMLSSQEKFMRKSIFSNQQKKGSIPTSESKSPGKQLSSIRKKEFNNAYSSIQLKEKDQSAKSGANGSVNTSIIDNNNMNVTQSKLLVPNPLLVNIDKKVDQVTERKTNKRMGKVNVNNRGTGLTEDLTGRTGNTYTGTVYINESQNLNNSNGFLVVQGKNKPVDKRPKMKTQINYNKKIQGQQQQNQLDITENQYQQKTVRNESNINHYIAQKMRQKTPLFEVSDERGYHSSNDPYMDKISADMYDQIIEDHIVRRGCWIPQRFKKFPRFVIFTQKDDMNDKDHLTSKFISLNPQVLALLASSDANGIAQLNDVLEEPSVQNQSAFNTALNHISVQKQASKLQNSNSATMEIEKSQSNLGSPNKSRMNLQDARADTKELNIVTARSGDNTPVLQKSVEKEGHQMPQDITLQSIDETIPIVLYQALLMVCQGQFQPEEVLQMLDQVTMSKLLNAANQPLATQESLKEIILTLLISKVKQFDPFDKVLLTKNIDNQILTSFRTLNKSNNVMSNTLKVVHQRFMPKNLTKNVKSQIPKSKVLYQLNNDIYDPLELQKQVDAMSDDERINFIKEFTAQHEISQQENQNLEQMENFDPRMSFMKSDEGDRDTLQKMSETGMLRNMGIDRQNLDTADLRKSLEDPNKQVENQLIDQQTMELMQSGNQKMAIQDAKEDGITKQKAINIPFGTNATGGKQTTKVTFPKHGGETGKRENFSIVTVKNDRSGNMSLEFDKNQVSTIGDPMTLTSEHMITNEHNNSNKMNFKEIKQPNNLRNVRKSNEQIELKMGNSLKDPETERRPEQQMLSARPQIQQPTQSSASIVSMVPTPNNPLHGLINVGVYKNPKEQKQHMKQLSIDRENIRTDRRKISNVQQQQHTSDYNEINDIRDSPLQSVIDDEMKENMQKQLEGVHQKASRHQNSQKIQSMDENDNSINKSDFTFLFNPQGKGSRDQMQPWSKNNSLSKHSVGETNNSNNDLSLPQILALKQIQKDQMNTELESGLHTKVGSIDTINSHGKKVDPKDQKLISNIKGQLEKEPTIKISGTLYNTDSIQVVVQENLINKYVPNKNALKPKNKKFGAGFNAKQNKSVLEKGQDDLLIQMATKDAKQRNSFSTKAVNLNNVQNVTDIQNVVTYMASDTYRKQMMTTSESAVIGGGVDPIGINREGLQIKRIINEIYKNLNKYTKRQSDKEDFVTCNELIFDNNKARELVDAPKEVAITQKDRVVPDYSALLQRNEITMQQIPKNDFVVGQAMRQLHQSKMEKRQDQK